MRSLSMAVLVGLVSGCAHNSVSLMEWWSRTTLIDASGNIYEGKAVFHFSYRDGTIEIPSSKYGALSGRFATQTSSASRSGAGLAVAASGGDTIVVPALSFQTVQAGNSYGTAYLQAGGKVVLKCNIGVDFKTLGLGDAQMIGSGICADATGEQSQLVFGR